MDRRHDAAMSDTDLDRLLAEALDVEPSPEFRAQVHARVAHQRPSTLWPLWSVGIPGVALAAMLLVAFALWRDVPGPAPAGDVLASRSVAVEWSLLRAPASAAARAAGDLPRPAARRTASSFSRTVLISASESAALRRLLAGTAGFSVVFSTVDDARAPASTTDIAITPISIDPIFVGSPAEGKQP